MKTNKRTFTLTLTSALLLLTVGGGTAQAKTVTPHHNATDIKAQGHSANIGWMSNKYEGATVGTTGKAKRLEAVKISTSGNLKGLTIKYRAHVANVGWQAYRAANTVAGTTGQSRQMEAFQMQVDGKDKDKYQIQYRSHLANVGWTKWVNAGQMTGTTGQARRMEALQFRIVNKPYDDGVVDPGEKPENPNKPEKPNNDKIVLEMNKEPLRVVQGNDYNEVKAVKTFTENGQPVSTNKLTFEKPSTDKVGTFTGKVSYKGMTKPFTVIVEPKPEPEKPTKADIHFSSGLRTYYEVPYNTAFDNKMLNVTAESDKDVFKSWTYGYDDEIKADGVDFSTKEPGNHVVTFTTEKDGHVTDTLLVTVNVLPLEQSSPFMVLEPGEHKEFQTTGTFRQLHDQFRYDHQDEMKVEDELIILPADTHAKEMANHWATYDMQIADTIDSQRIAPNHGKYGQGTSWIMDQNALNKYYIPVIHTTIAEAETIAFNNFKASPPHYEGMLKDFVTLDYTLHVRRNKREPHRFTALLITQSADRYGGYSEMPPAVPNW